MRAVWRAFFPIFAGVLLSQCPPLQAAPIQGIVWQPDNAIYDPVGQWDRLGARQLLVQWTAVDGMAFVQHKTLSSAPRLPDWKRIAGEPWANEVILGLAGRFSENAARSEVEGLAALSRELAKTPLPLNVTGWYFPVEVDPTWKEAVRLPALLAPLPRPLWISVYDSSNIGAVPMADFIGSWLPDDVGLFFQDGVGVHAREPGVAREYADKLAERFGKHRLRIILEAFRPAPGGGFRNATAEEIRGQLAAYEGYQIFIFDGPHYLPDALIEELVR